MKVALAIVFIVVLILLLIAQHEPQNTSQTLPSLPTFVVEDIKSFEVKSGDTVIVLAKLAQGKWVTQRGELDGNAAEQLLHDLQSMQIVRLATSKPERHATFDVNQYRAILKGKSSNVLLDVFVGKPATDLIGTYLRVTGSDDVLTVNKTLTWQLKRTPESWLKKEEYSE